MDEVTEPPRTHPITLTAQEYQTLVNELAARDPIIRFLMNKQDAAARQAVQQGLRSPAFDYAFGKNTP